MQKIKAAVIGASGYSGAELVALLAQHQAVELTGLYCSAGSQHDGSKFSELFPQFAQVVPQTIQAIQEHQQIVEQNDVIFLATPHEASHHLAAQFLQCESDCVVIDISGAYRFKQKTIYKQYYGFEHEYPELLKQAAFGLPEFNAEKIQQADLIAVAGCYVTSALLALKPLADKNMIQTQPVINAISGVSGAGRKANSNTSFCEVSIQPYGIFNHRHQPEIASQLACDVIFTPHLGHYERGIVSTITAKLKQKQTQQDLDVIYEQAYANQNAVRFSNVWPSIKAVKNTPFCDLKWQLAEDGQTLIVVSALDNLLKGAASQAVQCMELKFNLSCDIPLLKNIEHQPRSQIIRPRA